MMTQPPDPNLSDSQRLVVIETLVREYRGTQQDHEVRIRKLERGFYRMTAIGACVGAAVGSFVGRIPPIA